MQKCMLCRIGKTLNGAVNTELPLRCPFGSSCYALKFPHQRHLLDSVNSDERSVLESTQVACTTLDWGAAPDIIN